MKRNISQKIPLMAFIACLFLWAGNFAHGQTVSKTFSSGSISVDGCGTFCFTLPGVSFSTADFACGSTITDVNVSINWAKTDGTCTAPLTGCSFHNETSFRIDGPAGNVILANPNTWSGCETTASTSMTFNQGSAAPGPGFPVSGTYSPNGGNLNTLNGGSPFGTWNLVAGDNAGADPVCITSYTVTVSASGPSALAPGSINNAQSLCGGDDPAALNSTAGASGGTPAYSYQWQEDSGCTGSFSNISGATSASYDPPALTANTCYRRVVTDACGQSATSNTVEITVSPSPNITSISAIPDPVCAGTTLNLSAECEIGGVSTSFFRMAGIGGNFGNRAFDVVFSSGDRDGSIDRISDATYNSIAAGGPAALRASYDVLLFTWASPSTVNADWNTIIEPYLALGGSVFFEDNSNIGDLAPGISGAAGSSGSPWTFITPAPFPDLAANGVTGAFTNDHLYINPGGYPSWMQPYVNGSISGRIAAIAGIHPTGGGRLIVQGPDQDFHAIRGGGGTPGNQYQILLNQVDFLTAELNTAITWTGPAGFTATGGAVTDSPTISGTYTATCTSEDGCTDAATVSVTVLAAPPTITCPTDITVSNDPGQCAAIVSYTVTTSDDCGGETLAQTAGLASGSSFPVGTTSNSFTVTDPGGQTASCSFNVTVNDAEAPVANCNLGGGDITVNVDPGVCGAVVFYGNEFTDNCGAPAVAQTAGLPNAVLHPVGTTTNSFTATDGAGNVTTCSFNVTVIDNEAPVLNCSSAGAGNLLANPSFENGGPFDAIGADDWTTFDQARRLFGPGFSAQDGSVFMKMFGGNSGMFQDISGLSAGDVLEASIYMQNASFDPTGPAGGGSIKLEWIGAPGFEQSALFTNAAPLDVWTEVTLTATVPAGATGVRFVAICNMGAGGAIMYDNASLTVTSGGGSTFGDITVSADPGICGANLTVGNPAGSDNCGIVSLTNDFTGTGDASGLYPVGTTTVTYTATDAAGNSTTCSIDVTVTDDEAPSISCSAGTGNALANAGFEAGFASWTPFANAFIDGAFPLSGANSAKAFGNFTGSTNFSGFFQELPAAPGEDWLVSMNVASASTDAISGGNEAFVVIEWRDAGGGLISTVESPRFNASSPLDTYVPLSASGTAPAGTATIRVVGLHLQPAFAGGSVLFDDASAQRLIPGDVTVSNDPGQCAAFVAIPTPANSDNCGVTSITNDFTGGSDANATYPVGTTAVTFTATDAAGNSSACTINVTVEDNEAPSVSCDATGPIAIINPDFEGGPLGFGVSPGWSAFGNAFTENVAPFAGGQHVKMFGNFTGGFNVTVVQQDAPAAPGEVWTASAYLNNLSGDPMQGANEALVKLEFLSGGTPIGAVESARLDASSPTDVYTLFSATGTAPAGTDGVRIALLFLQPAFDGGAAQFDAASLAKSGSGDITVDNDPGECGATLSIPGPSFGDNCAVASITNDYTGTGADASGFYPVGSTVVTYTVTDVAGNSSTCTKTITVNDNEAPVISCGSSTNLLLNNSFEAGGAFDTPGADDWGQFGAAFRLFGPGFTAQEGDVFMKMFGVSGMFQDVAVTPGDDLEASIWIQNAGFDPMGAVGGGSIRLEWLGIPGAVEESAVIDASTPLDTWTQVTLNVTVPAGATGVRFVAFCNLPAGGAAMFDNASLSFAGSGSDVIEVDNDPGTCGAFVSVPGPDFSDNCAVASVTQDYTTTGADASGVYPVGSTVVTYTVTDDAGNSSTCTKTIIVNDAEAPTIDCGEGTNLLANNSFEAGGAFDTPGADDWGQFGAAFRLFGPAFAAQDGAVFMKMFGVSGMFQDIAVSPGDELTASIWIQNAGFDPMGPVGGGSIRLEWLGIPGAVVDSDVIDASTPLDTWTKVTLNTTVPAGATGVRFVAFCNLPAGGAAMFDNASLTILGSGSDLIVQDNDPGVCGANVTVPPPTFGDNCGVASVTNDYNGGGADASDFYPVGSTTVTYTVTDSAGNTATCSKVIQVNDAENPVANCNLGGGDITTTNDPGVCGAVVNYGNEFTDNCAVVSVTQDAGLPNGATFPVGTTTNTFTATDAAGNSITCSFNVTVTDDENPVINCDAPAAATNLLANNSFENGGGFDAIGADNWVTFDQARRLFGPAFTAQDGAVFMKMFGGNSGMFQDITGLNPGDVLNASIWMQNASFDPTGPVGGGSIKLEWIGAPGFEQSALFTNAAPLDVWTEVTLTATVPAGATGVRFVAICNLGAGGAIMYDNASLTVDAGGSALFGDISVTNDPGVCGADIAISNPASSDNCGVVSIVNDYNGTMDASDFYPVGTTVVTFTATDAAGNSTTCTIDVTVTDDEDPIISCPADLVLDCPADTDPSATGMATATDNCTASPTISNSDVSTPGCGATISIVRTWTAVDSVGNSSSCVQNITVQDTTPPSITCPADITLSVCDSIATWTVLSDDACGSVVVESVPPSGSVFDEGTTTTILNTSTDECGNVSTCTFDVTRRPTLILELCDDTSYVAVGYGPQSQANLSVSFIDGGLAPYTYLWMDDMGNVVSTDDATVVAPDTTTTYTVTVTDAEGCEISASHVIVAIDVTCSSKSSSKTSSSKTKSSTKSMTSMSSSKSKSYTKIVLCETKVKSGSKSAGAVSQKEKCVKAKSVSKYLYPEWKSNSKSKCSSSKSGSAKSKSKTYSLGPCGSPSFVSETCGEPTYYSCDECELGITSISVVYSGPSGVTVTAGTGKSPSKAFQTFSPVNDGDVLVIDGTLRPCGNGLTSKTYLLVDGMENAKFYTKCKSGSKMSGSKAPLVGAMDGSFTVTQSVDGIGTVCVGSGAKDDESVTQADDLGAGGKFQGEFTYDAYPNPFNSATTIEFTSNMDQNIKVEVYSLAGVRVAEVFNEEVMAGQPNKVEFRPNGISNGIYFARITTGDGQVFTKKLIYNR